MIVEISAAVAAAAFVLLAGYAIVFLRAAKRAVEEAGEAISSFKKEAEAATRESAAFMETGERLLRELEEKLHLLDPVFRSVRTTGRALDEASASVKQVTAAVSAAAASAEAALTKQREHVYDVAELASLGMQLWQKWRQERKAGSRQGE